MERDTLYTPPSILEDDGTLMFFSPEFQGSQYTPKNIPLSDIDLETHCNLTPC